jgi:hypothetical protein
LKATTCSAPLAGLEKHRGRAQPRPGALATRLEVVAMRMADLREGEGERGLQSWSGSIRRQNLHDLACVARVEGINQANSFGTAASAASKYSLREALGVGD